MVLLVCVCGVGGDQISGLQNRRHATATKGNEAIKTMAALDPQRGAARKPSEPMTAAVRAVSLRAVMVVILVFLWWC